MLNRIPDADVTLTQTAKDFGIHVGTLDTRLRQSRTNTGDQSGVTTSQKRRAQGTPEMHQLLEQENEGLRRAAAYLPQANVPAKALPAHESSPSTGPRGGVVPGITACSSTAPPAGACG